MDAKEAEDLRQVIAALFQIFRMQQEHIQELSASGQALRDAIEAHDPELFRKFQAKYSAIEKQTAKANSPLIRLIDEQVAALKRMGYWVN
jgi:hypothetical protein